MKADEHIQAGVLVDGAMCFDAGSSLVSEVGQRMGVNCGDNGRNVNSARREARFQLEHEKKFRIFR